MADVPKPSALREYLQEGVVVGTFLKLPSTEAIDLVAAAGFDVGIVDLEHSQLSEHQARHLIRHAYDNGLATVVRIPVIDRGLINRLLESGAVGIQLSTTRSRAQVEQLASSTRYAPDGDRSISLAQVRAGFGSISLRDFVDSQADDPPLLVVQIETATTQDPLEAVLQPPVDVAFVGTADLSVSMGTPGDLSDEDLVRRLEDIAQQAATTGVVFGGYAGDAAAAEQLVGLGARYLMVGSDLGALSGGLRRSLEDARTAIGSAL